MPVVEGAVVVVVLGSLGGAVDVGKTLEVVLLLPGRDLGSVGLVPDLTSTPSV